MVSDPEAIRHIFHETGIFIKSRTYQLINIIGFGEGSVISAHGMPLEWVHDVHSFEVIDR